MNEEGVIRTEGVRSETEEGAGEGYTRLDTQKGPNGFKDAGARESEGGLRRGASLEDATRGGEGAVNSPIQCSYHLPHSGPRNTARPPLGRSLSY